MPHEQTCSQRLVGIDLHQDLVIFLPQLLLIVPGVGREDKRERACAPFQSIGAEHRGVLQDGHVREEVLGRDGVGAVQQPQDALCALELGLDLPSIGLGDVVEKNMLPLHGSGGMSQECWWGGCSGGISGETTDSHTQRQMGVRWIELNATLCTLSDLSGGVRPVPL